MNNKQCIGQIKRLIGNWNQGGLNILMDECRHLIDSGGIDIAQDSPDSLFSPQIVLYVALQDLADRFKPVSQQGIKAAENLKHF
ncbi:MAG TPA: hypothetical protein DCP92_16775 [Nitrospiraceae bacterium]|jgi:hypothetical protein|nr:hypothetical protein [Nitrospiraceae bacterium]